MSESVAVSPVPKSKKLTTKTPPIFSFPVAMGEVALGKKVTRVAWDTREEYGYLAEDGYLLVHRQGKDFQWLVHKADMIALDWFVVEEGN